MDDSASSGRTNIFKKIIGFLNPSSHEDDVTEEEIISMVNEGHEQGVLRASEAEMIHNIFEFGDKEAKDIMTHRKNLIAIDGELSYNDAVPFIIENNKSRYPVYLEDIDNIIGVLHIKDAFAFAQKNEVFRTSIKDIKGLIREVDFVPETLNIHTLFQKMQAKKSHLVIVVDEYFYSVRSEFPGLPMGCFAPRVAAPSVCFALACILLAAAPTISSCFRHWRRSKLLPPLGELAVKRPERANSAGTATGRAGSPGPLWSHPGRALPASGGTPPHQGGSIPQRSRWTKPAAG